MRSGISAASVGYPSCSSRRPSGAASPDTASLILSESILRQVSANSQRDTRSPRGRMELQFMQGLSPRIRRELVPYFHLVPIRIGEEHVRLSWDEFATVLDLPARAL